MQMVNEKHFVNSIIKKVNRMKCLHILLVSVLCLSLLLVSYVPMCSAAAVNDYFVLVKDDVDVEAYAIPKWAIPEWMFLGSTDQGQLYYLFCATSGDEYDALMQFFSQTFTQEQGVIEYVEAWEHPQMGDTNADGQVGADDALLCLKVVVGKYQPQTMDEYMRFLVPDYPNSGSPVIIDAACALNILRMVVGKY